MSQQQIETLKQEWEKIAKTLRATYESKCIELGVTPLSDEELMRSSYSWKYGDWTQYPEQKKLVNQTHTTYYHSLEHAWKPFADQMREIRENSKPEPIMVKCSCGHTIKKNMVMNASLGTSCPDCYDRMSD